MDKLVIAKGLLWSCMLFSLSREAQAGDVSIASAKGPPVQIVVASVDALMQRTGTWCRDFIAKRGYRVQPKLAAELGRGINPVWLLETVDNSAGARSLAGPSPACL